MIKENYLAILKTVVIALVFLVIGSIIGVEFIPFNIRQMLNFAFFILILFSMFTGRGGFIKTKFGMYSYSFILGILTGSTYIYYFNTLGSEVFISAVIGVLLVFLLSFFIATKSNEQKLVAMYPIIWGGIFALMIIELINIFFFKFGIVDLVISGLAIIIYSMYSMYIMKSIQSRCRYGKLSEVELVNFSFSIFISFLNILLQLLRILSIVSRDEN